MLGRWCIRESCDDSIRPTLGEIDNTRNDLCEMAHYPSPIPVLTDALKKKSMRFDELSFMHG